MNFTKCCGGDGETDMFKTEQTHRAGALSSMGVKDKVEAFLIGLLSFADFSP